MVWPTLTTLYITLSIHVVLSHSSFIQILFTFATIVVSTSYYIHILLTVVCPTIFPIDNYLLSFCYLHVFLVDGFEHQSDLLDSKVIGV